MRCDVYVRCVISKESILIAGISASSRYRKGWGGGLTQFVSRPSRIIRPSFRIQQLLSCGLPYDRDQKISDPIRGGSSIRLKAAWRLRRTAKSGKPMICPNGTLSPSLAPASGCASISLTVVGSTKPIILSASIPLSSVPGGWRGIKIFVASFPACRRMGAFPPG
jgi:hypothetical protein